MAAAIAPRSGGLPAADAALSRGLEVHPMGRERGARDLDRPRLRAGGLRLELSPRATRSGSALAPSTRATTSRSRRAPGRGPRPRSGPLPGQLDPPQAAPGDRGRGLLLRRLGRPLPAAHGGGIGPRSTSGSRAGRELRAVVDEAKGRESALRDCAAFSASHRWKFEAMLRVQRLVPRVPPRLLGAMPAGWSARPSSTGRSGITCGSRRRSSPDPRPPPRGGPPSPGPPSPTSS